VNASIHLGPERLADDVRAPWSGHLGRPLSLVASLHPARSAVEPQPPHRPVQHARVAAPGATASRITPRLDICPAGAPILNLMVQYAPVDRTFAALADPTRRLVLERLGSGSATISELAQPFGMSLTGMKKHVRVLEETQLVATEKVGRTRLCHLGPRRLDDIQLWVETYRQMVNEQLDRFGDVLDRTKGDRQ
jgi:DNA-binding transcriptional ArsR family regulator